MRRFWRWAAADLKAGLARHDPSKLMIVPILFVALLALIDRAQYEIRLLADPGTIERPTRL